jgi:prophage regulatory protein
MRFIRLPKVIEKTGLSKSTLYGLIASGKFPAQIQLGPRCVAWEEDKIEKWMLQRILGLEAKQ